mgnify:CR=1 FL=1
MGQFYKYPGIFDLEIYKSIHIRVISNFFDILIVKHTGNRHIGIRIIGSIVPNINSELNEQCFFKYPIAVIK